MKEVISVLGFLVFLVVVSFSDLDTVFHLSKSYKSECTIEENPLFKWKKEIGKTFILDGIEIEITDIIIGDDCSDIRVESDISDSSSIFKKEEINYFRRNLKIDDNNLSVTIRSFKKSLNPKFKKFDFLEDSEIVYNIFVETDFPCYSNPGSFLFCNIISSDIFNLNNIVLKGELSKYQFFLEETILKYKEKYILNNQKS